MKTSPGVFWRVLLLMILVVCIGCGSRRGSGRYTLGPELVDGGVIFHFYEPEAESVYLVGDFNNWSLRADPMVDENGDGEWTLFYSLSPGVYEYKFVVNAVKWVPDPRNPETVPDGFDGRNSLLRIPQATPH